MLTYWYWHIDIDMIILTLIMAFWYRQNANWLIDIDILVLTSWYRHNDIDILILTYRYRHNDLDIMKLTWWCWHIDVDILISTCWYWQIDNDILISTEWYWPIDVDILMLTYWYRHNNIDMLILTYWYRHNDIDIMIWIYWYIIDTSKMLVFHCKHTYFWHSDNQTINFSMVLCILCIPRRRVLAGPGWAAWAGWAGGAVREHPRSKKHWKTLQKWPGTFRHSMFSWTFWTSWTPNTHFWPGNTSGASRTTLRSPPGPLRASSLGNIHKHIYTHIYGDFYFVLVERSDPLPPRRQLFESNFPNRSKRSDGCRISINLIIWIGHRRKSCMRWWSGYTYVDCK